MGGLNEKTVIDGKKQLSLVAASKLKVTLEQNINRVDLLTDTKIADVKVLMKELAE